MTDQRTGIKTREFFLPERKRNHRNILCRDSLIPQLFIERHIRVAVHGRHHGRLLPSRTKLLDIRDNCLPVRVPERRVVDHNVLVSDPISFEIVHEAVDGWDRLLVGCGAGVENVLGRLFPLILHGVKEQSVQLLKNRKYGFPRDRGPTTEHHIDLLFLQQFASFFRKKWPVRRWIDHDGFKLLA